MSQTKSPRGERDTWTMTDKNRSRSSRAAPGTAHRSI